MSSTLFLVLSSHRVRNNQIKLCELISSWKPFLEKMHMKKIHSVIHRTNDSDKWLVCVTYLKISDADLWFHCWTLSPGSWYLFAVYLQWILWYRNISEQSVVFFLWNCNIHASVKQAHQNPDLSLPIIRGSGIWNRSNIICLILA